MRGDSKRWGGVLKATGDHTPLFIASRNQDRQLAPETRDRLVYFRLLYLAPSETSPYIARNRWKPRALRHPPSNASPESLSLLMLAAHDVPGEGA